MNSKNSLLGFIKNEYIYSVLTKFVMIAVGLIQSVVLARYLGAELKGVNAYITSITSVGDVIVSFGIHHAYPYFRKQYGRDDIIEDFTSVVFFSYAFLEIFSLAAACFAPVSMEVRIACVLIPLLGYCRIISYITYIEHPNVINTWTVIMQFLDLIYIIVLYLFTERNYAWSVSILFFTNIVKTVVVTAILHVRPVFQKKLFGMLIRLLKFGFLPMIALLMTTLNYRIDVLMLHQYDFITNAMIGVYSLGISLSDKIVLIPDTLANVLVSKLSKGAPDEEVARVSRLGLWCSILLCIFIAIFGKLLIPLFYGVEYENSYSIILITSVGVLAVIYFKMISQYNIVNKKQNLNVIILSVAVGVNVILNFLLIPGWGIRGAAVATCAGNIVCGIFFILYFCRKTGVRIGEMLIIQRTDLEMLTGIIRKRI